MTTQTVEVSSLVRDMNLYPREHVNAQTISDYTEAMRAGAVFPPIVADKKSRRIVDGWKRTAAALRFAGPGALVEVEFRTYSDEGALLLDAIRLNALHGESLKHQDWYRCVILCEQLKISDSKIVGALNITMEKFRAISAQRVHRDEEGTAIVAAKNSSLHLISQGKSITSRQVTALAHVGGVSQTAIINQVIRLIEGRLLNKSDERSMSALEKLYGLLQGIFKKEVAA
jgi:hypothetical protein